MVEPTSECWEHVPKENGAAILKLVQHPSTVVLHSPPATKRPRYELHQELRLNPPPQPTPEACYGCVDWFQF